MKEYAGAAVPIRTAAERFRAANQAMLAAGTGRCVQMAAQKFVVFAEKATFPLSKNLAAAGTGRCVQMAAQKFVAAAEKATFPLSKNLAAAGTGRYVQMAA